MTQTRLRPTGHAASARLADKAKHHCHIRQWELLNFVIAGSLARIFRARPVNATGDRSAGYAVKMLRPNLQNDPLAIDLLQREAAVAQTVSHPHLVPVLSCHVLEAPRLLVMPWLEGASLQQRITAGQSFDVLKTLWIARQAAEGLAALHKAGWMHGDLSPGNIHLSLTGHVTLIDLSFARRHDETGSAIDRPIMGTCSYLAPEYLTSALRPDIRSDIYSLGAVMFHMLAGHLPYPTADLNELATLHRQSTPPDLTRLVPEIPREVVALVRRMISKEPLRRPQTPNELVDRLAALEISLFSQSAR